MATQLNGFSDDFDRLAEAGFVTIAGEPRLCVRGDGGYVLYDSAEWNSAGPAAYECDDHGAVRRLGRPTGDRVPATVLAAAISQEKMKMTTKGLIAEAQSIAGCGWDDYAPDGTPSERCLACANAAPLGTDGDYTDAERARLRELADELAVGGVPSMPGEVR